MPNAYLISSTYRDRPDTGKDPTVVVNETVSLMQAVTQLVSHINRQHLKPRSVDKLVIVAENKKGTILVGTGLSVSTVKALQPLAQFLVPGADHVGVETVGVTINNEVGNRDVGDAIAQALKTTVLMDKEKFAPRMA